MFQKVVTGIYKITGFLVNALALLGMILLLPGLAGIRPYIVLSGSMEPALTTGGIVFVNTREDTFGIGDVITYEAAGGQVTHRIIRTGTEKSDEKQQLKNTCYITKGDANEREDIAPVEYTQIIGKVCLFLPFAGYLLSMVQRPAGILSIGALFMVYLFLMLTGQERKK